MQGTLEPVDTDFLNRNQISCLIEYPLDEIEVNLIWFILRIIQNKILPSTRLVERWNFGNIIM